MGSVKRDWKMGGVGLCLSLPVCYGGQRAGAIFMSDDRKDGLPLRFGPRGVFRCTATIAQTLGEDPRFGRPVGPIANVRLAASSKAKDDRETMRGRITMTSRVPMVSLERPRTR